MGTRARVEVMNHGKCVASIYCQFDGYPSGLGMELAEFLKPRTVVNGIGDETAKIAANGMGCLAAQLVADLKGDSIGKVYLCAPMTEDGECGEEFIYRLSHVDGKYLIQVTGGNMTAFGCPNDPASFKGLFSGGLPEFIEWASKES